MSKKPKTFFITAVLTILAFSTFLLPEEKNVCIFDETENDHIYVNHISSGPQALKLSPLEKITDYISDENETEEIQGLLVAINYKKNEIYIFDKILRAFMAFKLDTFRNGAKPLRTVLKGRGKGPNDVVYPIDMVFDPVRDRLYIIDLYNAFYVYDTAFNEQGRFYLTKRPYRVTVAGNKVLINRYQGLKKKNTIDIVDPVALKIEGGMFPGTTKGDPLENSSYNTVFVEKVAPNRYMAARNYPNFNIFLCTPDKVIKTFCSPSLAKIRLPRPEHRVFKGDRKYYGLVPYIDIHFSPSKKWLFTLSTLGWKEIAKKLKISKYICIYDLEGNTLCEHKLPEYVGNELSHIVFDQQNQVLYFTTYDYIQPFKVGRL